MIVATACQNNGKQSDTASPEGATAMSSDESKPEGVAPFTIQVGSKWQNGGEWYEVEKSEDGNGFVFRGGSTHEGGFFINMKPIADDKYEAQRPDWEGTFTAESKTVDGTPCIIIRDQEKKVKSVMIENKKDDVGLREYICKVLARRLAGNYTDSKGERWVLTADQKYQAGSQKGQYKFEEEFDTPVMTITMENGRHWMLKVNDGDIEMIPASSDENGEVWEEVPEEHIYLTLLPEETKKWRYPWTSTQVLTVGDVAGYSKDELRIIRNEIWARHGYNFQSDDLKKRFSAVTSYKPVANNDDVKLTATESLNVEVIKYAESLPDEEN